MNLTGPWVLTYLVKYYSRCFCEGVLDEIDIEAYRSEADRYPSYGWASRNQSKAKLEERLTISQMPTTVQTTKQLHSFHILEK